MRTQPYKHAADGEHGLISRVSKVADEAKSFDELLSLSSSAQFTNARIRRVILYSFFNISASDLKEKPRYTQLLASNKKGLSYLSGIRSAKRTEIITKPADKAKLSEKAKKQYALECEADKLYCLCGSVILPGPYFMKATPYITAK